MNFEEIKGAGGDNWCVIIQSYPSKIKKNLVKKLIEIFNLEKKDAEQVLGNTPLILIDGLSFNVAGNVRTYFVKMGAVVETTNHEMIKKNCYQIMWPELPDLSFFSHETEAEEKVVKKSEKAPEAKAKEEPAKTALGQQPLPSEVVPPPPPPKLSVLEKLKAAHGKSTPAIPKEQEIQAPPPPVPAARIDDQAPQGVWEQKAKELSERLARMKEGKQNVPAQPTQEAVNLKTDLQDKLALERQKAEALEKEREALQRSISEKADAMTQEIERLTGQNQELIQKIRTLEDQLQQREANLRNDFDSKLLAERQKADELARHRESLERSIDEHAGNFTKDIDVLNSRNQELMQKINELESLMFQKDEALKHSQNQIAELETKRRDVEEKTAEIQRQMEEKAAKLNEFANRADALAGLEQRHQSEVESLKNEALQLRSLSDSERTAFQAQMADQQKKIEELTEVLREKQNSSDELQAEIDELRNKNEEYRHKVDMTEQSLTQTRDLLRAREKELQGRDDMLDEFGKRLEELTRQNQEVETIRQENAQFAAERTGLLQEFEARFAEQEARIAKIDEEARRSRSRIERKLTAANRELGEWARGVEALKGGLQKLAMFLASDAVTIDAERKLPVRPVPSKSTTPPGNLPPRGE